MTNRGIDTNISSHLALIFLLVFGFAIALYVLNVGQEVVNSAKRSDEFNINQRIRHDKNFQDVPELN